MKVGYIRRPLPYHIVCLPCVVDALSVRQAEGTACGNVELHLLCHLTNRKKSTHIAVHYLARIKIKPNKTKRRLRLHTVLHAIVRSRYDTIQDCFHTVEGVVVLSLPFRTISQVYTSNRSNEYKLNRRGQKLQYHENNIQNNNSDNNHIEKRTRTVIVPTAVENKHTVVTKKRCL